MDTEVPNCNMEKEVANPNEHLIRKKRKIAEKHRRGNDTRTDAERQEAGRKQRQRQSRKYALCSLCDENLARRGWAKNYCIKCAKKKGYSPQKKDDRSHHKKVAKIPKPKLAAHADAQSKVKKEPKQKKPNHYVKDSVASRHQDRDNMSEGLNANVKVKKEPKVIAEGTITKGADEGAAGCSIPKRLKRLTRCGCPFHGKENFGEDIEVI